jgi:glycosyltransferase involved in cell wall biosynthesis
MHEGRISNHGDTLVLSMTRTCIIVSPYFPPSTLAGVHRARHLAKYLPAAGWDPIVVCVDEDYHEQRLDPTLAQLVPSSVEVVKVSAISQRLCRPFSFGEISLRAWWPLRNAVMRILESREVGVVLITGAPFYPMLLAGEIKRRFRVPVVLDFQDPWVSAWGGSLPIWSKGGLAHKLALMLEPRALRSADFVTSVSETQNRELRGRYPWMSAAKMAAIPIGGDPEDFEMLRHSPPNNKPGLFRQDKITLCFVGTFMPRTGPVMELLLRAFAQARRAQPLLMDRVDLLFVGTSNQPDDKTTFSVKPIAIDLGVADAVQEIPQRLPFLEAISILSCADGILLIGSDEPHYTASKIYPALMAQRPCLSIFHESSSSHEILSRASGVIAFGFSGAAMLQKLVEPLADAIVRIATAPDALGKPDPAVYEAFTARTIARRYADVFNLLVHPS